MIRFSQSNSDLFIPDGAKAAEALLRTTHLGVGAHQDDLEFMALHGIMECYEHPVNWFGGVTCTDGAGSARNGLYAAYSDKDMIAVRAEEQRKAATIGKYSFMAQLAHASTSLKRAKIRQTAVMELKEILKASSPQVVYTHNPADKHATHIGVFLAVLEAIRSLRPDERPQRLLGCELWRGLDWLSDKDKVLLSLGKEPLLGRRLRAVFESQIAGGKRYDRAVEGRYWANATFYDSHAVDGEEQLAYAMDLTALIEDDTLDPFDFVLAHVAALKSEIASLMNKATD